MAKRTNSIVTPADEGMRAARREARIEKEHVAEIRQLIIEIAERVNEIEVLDPHGDLVEWFETSRRTRITDEVLKVLD